MALTNEAIEEILGDDAVSGIKLKSGKELTADLLLTVQMGISIEEESRDEILN